MDPDIVIGLLEKKDFKKNIINKLNDDIDIPLINEQTEKKILSKIYDVFIKTLKETLEDQS